MNSSILLMLFVVAFLIVLIAVWRTLRPRQVIVFDHQRGIHYRNGKLTGVLEPGRYWVTAAAQIVPVEIRKQLQQIPGQEILTSDGITVKLSVSMEYTIVDPARMVRSSNNFVGLVYAQAQMDVRRAVGELTFDALLMAREPVSRQLFELMVAPLAELGAELNSARIVDIMLPSDIRRALTQSITAQKEGVAALERARGETASLRSLANAARLMQDHPGLLQLRAVQAVESSRGKAILELKLDAGEPKAQG